MTEVRPDGSLTQKELHTFQIRLSYLQDSKDETAQLLQKRPP